MQRCKEIAYSYGQIIPEPGTGTFNGKLTHAGSSINSSIIDGCSNIIGIFIEMSSRTKRLCMYLSRNY